MSTLLKKLSTSSEKIKRLHIVKASNIKKFQSQSIIDNSSNQFLKVTGNIPLDLEINPKDHFVFISKEQTYLTHGIHKYPAKFFPELPKWLIQKYSKPHDNILDPFSGSGTVNIESLLLNRNSVGIDIDPFANFLSKVKTTKLNLKKLKSAKKHIFNLLLKYDPNKVNKNNIPKFPYVEHWFQKNILFEITYIKQIINNLETTTNIKNFYLICFSSIIRKVSNASNECTRTVIRKKHKKNIQDFDAIHLFYDAIVTNILRYEDFHKIKPRGISVKFPKGMDARNIKFPANTFDLAITSPPYINAVDYPRTHQLELFLLDFCKDSLANLKKQHIGTENVYIKDFKRLHLMGVTELDRKLIKVFNVDPKRSYIAYNYFVDMEKNLKETFNVLKDGGRYILVVGNNNIRGQVFENWKYLMEISKDVGFSIDTYFSSGIIKHFMRFNKKDKINTDWVIVLKK